jgi:hypothetical protein
MGLTDNRETHEAYPPFFLQSKRWRLKSLEIEQRHARSFPIRFLPSTAPNKQPLHKSLFSDLSNKTSFC